MILPATSGQDNKYYSDLIWDTWSISLNSGLTSFYGDLSVHDNNLSKKYQIESGPAASIIGAKYLFKNKLSVCGQILIVSFSAGTYYQEFHAKILEYNLHLNADLVRMFFLHREYPFGFNAFAGIGHFFFDSESHWKRDDILPPSGKIDIQIRTSTPEFVYFFGGGGFYDISGKFAVTADMAIRQARNDKLDTKKDNAPYISWDYYVYTSIGVSMRIFHLRKQKSIDNWEDEWQKVSKEQ